ncbi:MAG: sigma-70 family RNA polymerase sigma factor [Phycisphaerae bacterium]|jgi:RNA polymerase sigma factor (TIGR02999 family)
MSSPAREDVTQLLVDSHLSASERAELLLPIVYEHLRGLARKLMAAERSDHMLQATALVHEAFVRLVGQQPATWTNRKHFFFAAGRAMQQILVEHARARRRRKRGGKAQRIPLSAVNLGQEQDPLVILALDEAFRRLEQEEQEAAEVVRLRFFAGLSGDETAAVLEISPRQVDRLWAFARAWLFRELEAGEKSP